MSTMSDLAQEVQELAKKVNALSYKLDDWSRTNLNAMAYQACADMVSEDQEALKMHKQKLQGILKQFGAD